MLHRGLSMATPLALGGSIASLIAAFEVRHTPLWILAACLFVAGVAAGAGYLLTQEEHGDSARADAKADHSSVAAAAAHDAIAQGPITDSAVVNNQAPIHVGRDLNVGVNVAPPALQPPTVSVVAHGDCGWLSLTNNDSVERFIVEISEFEQGSGERLRPLRQTGEEVGSLRRDEQLWLRLLCVEPTRPQFIPTTVGMAVDRITGPPYLNRIDRGVRLVRFNGQPARDLEVAVSLGASLLIRVLSDHHPQVSLRCNYGITQRRQLIIPFDGDALERANADEEAAWQQTITDLQQRVQELEASGETND